jgi:hypothetical protein
MKVCRILKLRDDEDIIQHNLAYYYNIGVKNTFIMFHLPSEELLQKVNEFAEKVPDCNIRFLYHDKEGAGKNVINEELLRVLTNRAQDEGFKWIVGSDADEFLILKKHKNINDFIKKYDSDGESLSFLFKWANYYLTPKNKDLSVDFYDKMEYRNDYMGWTKSIGKFSSKKMFFVQGLHHIADKKYGQTSKNIKQYRISSGIAFYAHFPYRNKEQFVSKQKVQAQKFGGWRKKELKSDPIFFEIFFDNIMKERQKWPLNFDNKNIKNSNIIYDPIPNKDLMRLPWK